MKIQMMGAFKLRQIDGLFRQSALRTDNKVQPLLTAAVGFALVVSQTSALARTDLQQTQADGADGSWANIVAARGAGVPDLLYTQDLLLNLQSFRVTDPTIPTAGSCGGGSPRCLDLTANELNAAYQQTAGEEAITFRSTLTDASYVQTNNVLTRLAQLRAGASGVAVATTGFQNSLPGLADIGDQLRTGYGGGASADQLSETGKLGGFISGSFATGDVDTTDRENGYDYDAYGISAGVDYRLTPNFVFGGALGYSSLDSDYNRSATVSGGGVEATGYSVSLYGTYYRDSFYLDGIASYGQNDYDLTRRVLVIPGAAAGVAVDPADWDLTARASTDSDQYVLGLGGGYDFYQGPTTITPYARINYMKAEIDGYQESGAQWADYAVDSYDVESLISVVGVSVTHAMSRDFGVVIPHGRIGWVHEYKNDAPRVNYQYVWETQAPGDSPWIFPLNGEKPDRNYFSLGLGASAVLADGMQLFVDYQTVLGHDRVTEHLVSLGGRIEF